MARHESDREDLMREATALRERIEMRVPGEAEPVVAGFRSDGRLSLYFGADPAFHFEADGGLRRAFCDGDLYRSQGTTLARLRRKRTEAGTVLTRHDLDPGALNRFLERMRSRLTVLLAALDANTVTTLREIPADGRVSLQLRSRLPDASLGRLAPPLKK